MNDDTTESRRAARLASAPFKMLVWIVLAAGAVAVLLWAIGP